MLSTIATIVGILNGLVSAYVLLVVKRMERLEDRLAKKAEDLIDGRFEAIGQKCEMKHEMVSQQISGINGRLQKGDGAFDTLGTGEHRLELKLVAAIGDLKQTMLRECADRGDVAKLSEQVATLAGRFGAIERAVAMDIESAKRR